MQADAKSSRSPFFTANGDVHANPTAAVCLNEIDPQRPQFWKITSDLQYGHGDQWNKGQRWMCSLTLYTNVNTIRPPNKRKLPIVFIRWS